jgi:hypothetical protein
MRLDEFASRGDVPVSRRLHELRDVGEDVRLFLQNRNCWWA